MNSSSRKYQSSHRSRTKINKGDPKIHRCNCEKKHKNNTRGWRTDEKNETGFVMNSLQISIGVILQAIQILSLALLKG
jgi:hypothetical protein